MISQNKNVRQIVWYVDTAVLYCYNTEGDRHSVVSQTSIKMDVTYEMSKFTRGEAILDAFDIIGSELWTIDRSDAIDHPISSLMTCGQHVEPQAIAGY